MYWLHVFLENFFWRTEILRGKWKEDRIRNIRLQFARNASSPDWKRIAIGSGWHLPMDCHCRLRLPKYFVYLFLLRRLHPFITSFSWRTSSPAPPTGGGSALRHRMLWNWSSSQLVLGYYWFIFLTPHLQKIDDNFFLLRFWWNSEWNTFQNILRKKKFLQIFIFFKIPKKLFLSNTFFKIIHLIRFITFGERERGGVSISFSRTVQTNYLYLRLKLNIFKWKLEYFM